MTIAAPRRESNGASGLPLPIKGASTGSDYTSPLEYLETVASPPTGSKKPHTTTRTSSALFLNTTLTAAVLVACLAMALSVWLWQGGPSTATDNDARGAVISPPVNLPALVASFEKTIEELSQFQTQDVHDAAAVTVRTSSASSDQARLAVQRWMDMKPVAASIDDLLSQRLAKVVEAQSLEAKLRASTAAYQAANEASELYRSSAMNSIELLRKNELDQEVLQSSINETRDEANELHRQLQQHDTVIFDLMAKCDAAESQLAELERRVSEHRGQNASLSNVVQSYQAQVNKHNASVVNASHDLQNALKLKDVLVLDLSDKRVQLGNLRLKEKEKMDLLSTFISIQDQFAAVAQESPQDEATVSLKALMDLEQQHMERLNEELLAVSDSPSKIDLVDADYETGLHRSHIRLQRVQHELRYESIRFIYESLPLGTSRTFPAVLATVASHIEQARDRLDQIKVNITSAEQAVSETEHRHEETVALIDRLKLFELEADSRYEVLITSLVNAEREQHQGQQTILALQTEFEQHESTLTKLKLDLEAAVEHKRSLQKDILHLGETQAAKQRQLLQLQHEGKKMMQVCSEDMSVALRHLNNTNVKYDEVQQLATALSTLNDDIADLDQHLQQRSQRLLDSINSGFRQHKPLE